jgi:hypothetical protein
MYQKSKIYPYKPEHISQLRVIYEFTPFIKFYVLFAL